MDDMFQNISSTVRGQIIQRKAESCEIDKPGPFCLVIFGASGDLTKRKLIPSIYRLYSLKLIEGEFIVLGVARSEMKDETFRESMLETVKKANPDDFSDSSWREFAKRLFYSKVEYSELNSYNSLKENIFTLEKEHQLTNRVRDEKVKVFRSIKPFPLDRLGEYAALLEREDHSWKTL